MSNSKLVREDIYIEKKEAGKNTVSVTEGATSTRTQLISSSVPDHFVNKSADILDQLGFIQNHIKSVDEVADAAINSCLTEIKQRPDSEVILQSIDLRLA